MKKISTSKAKKLAWSIFSRYIRLRDSRNGRANCVTCGRSYPITGVGCIQAGHFIPGRHNSILYDERGVHAQCYGCNVGQKGAWVEYERFMLSCYGPDVVEDLKKKSKEIVTLSAADHMCIADIYRNKIEELGGWPEA